MPPFLKLTNHELLARMALDDVTRYPYIFHQLDVFNLKPDQKIDDITWYQGICTNKKISLFKRRPIKT